MAQALGYEAIKQGKEVLYRSIFDLVRDFLKDEAFKQQDKTLRRYLKPNLVIIDWNWAQPLLDLDKITCYSTATVSENKNSSFETVLHIYRLRKRAT